jgi:hypothetical protein
MKTLIVHYMALRLMCGCMGRQYAQGVSHLAPISAVVCFLARGKWELKEK